MSQLTGSGDTGPTEVSPEPSTDEVLAAHEEPQREGLNARLNWLRAGVLGANDGIVSTAGIVVGVAGATDARGAIFVAGLAGLVAGALSMAAGEYVSVSTQRDTERALIDKERDELRTMPEEELAELVGLYQEKGLSHDLAVQVAEQLTAKNALEAHLDAELHLDEDDLSSPWTAAITSAVSFTVGALLPLLAIILLPPTLRVPLTFVVVVLALAVTGAASARFGQAPAGPAVRRNIIGGAIAMAVTYAVGSAVGRL